MNQLTEIARQVEAAARLLDCTRHLQQEDHHLITDEAVRSMGLHVEAIHAAEQRQQGITHPASDELKTSVAAMLPGQHITRMTGEDILDEYVACRLSSVASAIRVIETVYMEDDGSRANRLLGDALFECLQWLESAQLALVLYLEGAPLSMVA